MNEVIRILIGHDLITVQMKSLQSKRRCVSRNKCLDPGYKEKRSSQQVGF